MSMTFEEAEKYLMSVEDDGEQATFAVAQLAPLTPDVVYTPLKRYEHMQSVAAAAGKNVDAADIKSLIFSIALVGLTFSTKDAVGGQVDIGGLTYHNEDLGDWQITTDKRRIDLVPTEETRQAIEALSKMDPMKLRKVLGRLIDTTPMTTVHSETFIRDVMDHDELPFEESCKILAVKLRNVMDEGDSVDLRTLNVRPGDDHGFCVYVTAKRLVLEKTPETTIS